MKQIILYNQQITRLFEAGKLSTKEESCGFLLPKTLVHVDDYEGCPTLAPYIEICENVSDDPEKFFEFSDEDVKKVFILSQTQPIILWHTHVDKSYSSSFLSSQDVITAREWEFPMLMVNLLNGASDYYDPNEKVEYIGRKWSYSYRNCYDLMFDFYLEEFGIELPRFYLEHPKAWEDDGWDSYESNLPAQFVQISEKELRYGDLLLMTIGRAASANHIGVMLEPEKNLFLHHLAETFSREDSLDQAYRKRIHSCWRHQSLL